MRKLLTFLFTCCLFQQLVGQTSVVQDSEGKTSIVIPKATTVNFNFADAKLEFGTKVIKLNDIGKAPFTLSLIGSLKSTSGTTKIFDGKGFSPEGNVGVSFLKFWPDSDASDRDGLSWGYATVSHSFGTQKLYDSLAVFSDIVKKKRLSTPSVVIGLNRTDQRYFSFGFAAQAIFHYTNYEDLDDYVVAKQTVRYNSDSTQSSLITGKEENTKGLYSKYESGFNELNLIADVLCWPKFLNDRIAIGLHLKSNFREIDKPKVSGTFGIYLTKAGDEKSDPTAIVGGLVFETQDFFKKRSTDSFKSRSLVNLVVGYNFKY